VKKWEKIDQIPANRNIKLIKLRENSTSIKDFRLQEMEDKTPNSENSSYPLRE